MRILALDIGTSSLKAAVLDVATAALLEAMQRGHRQAVADLGLGDKFERVFLTGGGAEVVQRLIPEYAGENVHLFQEGSLHGIARLFQAHSSPAGNGE